MIKEQEDKFDVDSDWVMSQLAELLPDGGRLDHEVCKLDNTYFDTPGAGLRVFGITLRRRVGGSETGWQLKVPSGRPGLNCRAARGRRRCHVHWRRASRGC
jgi:inorganic triphosphatase YgiF